jgi:hypothetical protein
VKLNNAIEEKDDLNLKMRLKIDKIGHHNLTK